MSELKKVDISLACKAIMDLFGSGSDDEQQEKIRRCLILHLIEALEDEVSE